MPIFSKASQDKLDTCHHDLQTLFNEVIKRFDCTILEGHRDYQRQLDLYDRGKTKTLSSNHLTTPSNAVDVMPYPIDWEDLQGQHAFATEVYHIAMQLGIRVQWGGNFKTFYDAPHWELL